MTRPKYNRLKIGDTVQVQNLKGISDGTECVITEVKKNRQGETTYIMIDAHDDFGPFSIDAGYIGCLI